MATEPAGDVKSLNEVKHKDKLPTQKQKLRALQISGQVILVSSWHSKIVSQHQALDGCAWNTKDTKTNLPEHTPQQDIPHKDYLHTYASSSGFSAIDLPIGACDPCSLLPLALPGTRPTSRWIPSLLCDKRPQHTNTFGNLFFLASLTTAWIDLYALGHLPMSCGLVQMIWRFREVTVKSGAG